jgi:hypothetical protein
MRIQVIDGKTGTGNYQWGINTSRSGTPPHELYFGMAGGEQVNSYGRHQPS